MKLQTNKSRKNVAIINMLILLTLIVSIFFSYVDIHIVGKTDEIIISICILLLIYLSYLGAPFFKYDSEGETLIMQNEKALSFSLFVKDLKSDFPKTKLIDYKIKYKLLFKKRLDVYISSKRVDSGVTKVSFDISYLDYKDIKNIDISLSKVINENKNRNIKNNIDKDEFEGVASKQGVEKN